jgi:small-conductance mechanosensitive channel
MSNFPIQMQTYDPVATDQSIAQLQGELQEEVTLNNKLKELDSDGKIQDAQNFVSEHGEKIKSQYQSIEQLDVDLRTLVLENKTLEEQDEAFNALIHSNEYLELARMMSDLKAKITSLDSFLVEHGVKGPAN